MDIPDWLAWLFLGVVVLHAFSVVRIVRRLRGPDPAVRVAARLDLVDASGGLLAMLGLALGSAVADCWLWLVLAGLALTGAAYAVKGARLLRARRHPTSPTCGTAPEKR
ncbi:hypothetical protein ACIPRD_03535 [Streptomyces sp. NPDC090108]|uniref:hypothetical protein n=1 Tax=Streptomyces sp. NPDC090108 TaxID=3365947 RepID=UPI0037F13FF7